MFLDHVCHGANKNGVCVQRRGALQSNTMLAGDILGQDIDVEKDLDVVTYETDRDADHVFNTPLSQRYQVILDLRSHPGFRAASGGLVAP